MLADVRAGPAVKPPAQLAVGLAGVAAQGGQLGGQLSEPACEVMGRSRSLVRQAPEEYGSRFRITSIFNSSANGLDRAMFWGKMATWLYAWTGKQQPLASAHAFWGRCVQQMMPSGLAALHTCHGGRAGPAGRLSESSHSSCPGPEELHSAGSPDTPPTVVCMGARNCMSRGTSATIVGPAAAARARRRAPAPRACGTRVCRLGTSVPARVKGGQLLGWLWNCFAPRRLVNVLPVTGKHRRVLSRSAFPHPCGCCSNTPLRCRPGGKTSMPPLYISCFCLPPARRWWWLLGGRLVVRSGLHMSVWPGVAAAVGGCSVVLPDVTHCCC